MKKKLEFLIIHCTASRKNAEVSKAQIIKMHTSPEPEGRGWKQVGYADMIHLNGVIENLVPYNEDDFVDSFEITNGAKGYNSISRHIVYVGGLDFDGKKWVPGDTRTPEQKESLESYVKEFLKKHPKAKILGHNQVGNKACPCFDVKEWALSIGINEKHIL